MLSAINRHRPGAGALLIRPFSRIRRNKDGFTAVEFAAVAAPFFALIFGIIEITAVYFGTYTLENAVEQTARLIRTGQAHEQGMSKTSFIQQVCDKVTVFTDCTSKLQVDVRASPDFGGMSPPNAQDGNGDLDPNGLNGWDLGDGGSVVLVSVYYKWALIGQIPGIGLGNQSDGSRLITALAVFRNEPFEN